MTCPSCHGHGHFEEEHECDSRCHAVFRECAVWFDIIDCEICDGEGEVTEQAPPKNFPYTERTL